MAGRSAKKTDGERTYRLCPFRLLWTIASLTKTETAMRSVVVIYLDPMIQPVVTRKPSGGFTSRAIVTLPGQKPRASGVLGAFDTAAKAYECALGFGRYEIDRHRMFKLLAAQAAGTT
jgi:hypothetical protein